MAELLVLPDQRIPMPEGVRLSARLWLPALGGPVPTAIEMMRCCAQVAAQDWCTGAVGMGWGKSWGAFNALQAPPLYSPTLKAVIAFCRTMDRFDDDIHVKGGCFPRENYGWAQTTLSYPALPADPALRTDWQEEQLRKLKGIRWLAPRWASRKGDDMVFEREKTVEVPRDWV